jgi:protein-S-isoprenylcysteine O-methyltransferase Ste14
VGSRKIGIHPVLGWIIVTILIEEESLEPAIGTKYVDYKKKVRGRIIPGIPI